MKGKASELGLRREIRTMMVEAFDFVQKYW